MANDPTATPGTPESTGAPPPAAPGAAAPAPMSGSSGLPAPMAGPPAVPTTPGKIKANTFTYHGQLGALYRVWLAQLFFSILTLGIYHCWGKTRLRRYMIGALELAGDRLEYRGTGKELFLGLLKIMPIYLIVSVLMQALDHAQRGLGGALLLPIILYVVPVAQYSGFRYRYNRISWRGIRGVMRGSALGYGAKYLGGTLLGFVTLGFMMPSIDLRRWEYQVQNMRFGKTPFRFKGDPARLQKTNIITLLLAIPTLGFSRIWYTAALQQEKLRGLALGNIRFRSTATGGDLLRFAMGNLALMIFTIGLASPVVMQRTMRLYARVIAVGGDLDQFNADQDKLAGPGDAEGLLDVLDVDIGMIGA